MSGSVLALDIGEKRIGVAVASRIARLPRPLTTLNNDDAFLDSLNQLIMTESVDAIVVGLPRNLSGEPTAQTQYVQDFARQLPALPVYFQDEALTSVKAETELKRRGTPYGKADIDALAATYILEDYLVAEGNA